jgi:hypothetical protein
MPGKAALCLLLGALLSGCGPGRGLSAEQRAMRNELAPSLLYTVKGVTYAVSRRPEARGGIRVRTRGGVDGSRKSAYAAAIRAYGCQSLSLTETVPVWRVAEGKGSFCEFDRNRGVNR